MQATIETTSGNQFTTDPAMNDLLIANTHQYAPSKYHLRRGENQTHQQSSGLLFSTWFGQGAWLRNAMSDTNSNNSRPKQMPSERHSTISSMPATFRPRTAHETWAWMDWTDQETTITSDMHRGFVVPDGWDEVHFNRGATITVNAAAPN